MSVFTGRIFSGAKGGSVFGSAVAPLRVNQESDAIPRTVERTEDGAAMEKLRGALTGMQLDRKITEKPEWTIPKLVFYPSNTANPSIEDKTAEGKAIGQSAIVSRGTDRNTFRPVVGDSESIGSETIEAINLPGEQIQLPPDIFRPLPVYARDWCSELRFAIAARQCYFGQPFPRKLEAPPRWLYEQANACEDSVVEWSPRGVDEETDGPMRLEDQENQDVDVWEEDWEWDSAGSEWTGSDTSSSPSNSSDSTSGYEPDSPERPWTPEFESDQTLPSLTTYMRILGVINGDCTL